jgi:hypothetical protein
MNNIIFQIVLVVISVGLFLTVVNPLYTSEDPAKPGIKAIQAEIAKYDEAINKSQQLNDAKNKLVASKNSIDATQLANLAKLLPDSIDNIRLIIDINNIAQPLGLVLKNLRFTGGDSKGGGSTASGSGDSREIAIGGDQTVGSVTLSFNVTAQYNVFKEFIKKLESSLRLLDVTIVSMKPLDKTDFYDFSVTLKTYWLR